MVVAVLTMNIRTSKRRPSWRLLLALLFCTGLALAPSVAEARAGSSYGSAPSSMGSRGLRTYENNGAQPLSRSMTPTPQAPNQQPGYAPAPSFGGFGGGSFFSRHPFLTGLAGGFIGSWLFGHAAFAAGGMGGHSMLGTLFELLLIGGLIYFAFRLFRGSAFAPGWLGGTGGFMPRAAGAAAAPANRGREIAIGDADLGAFQALHASVQDAWSAGDLGRMRQLMTPEMLSYFSEELTRNASQGVRNVISNVELSKGELSEGWEEGDLQYATAYMRWRALDYSVRLGQTPDQLNQVVAGNPHAPVETEEVWTFVRRRGGQWLLSAIQQV